MKMKDCIFRNFFGIFCVLLVLSFVGCDSGGWIYENAELAQFNDESKKLTIHEESYYWYQGNKIKLSPIYNKKYILVDKSRMAEIKGKKEIQEVNIGVKKRLMRKNYGWAIVDSDVEICKDNGVTYSSSFYITPDGDEVGVSHLFYVKLKKESDFIKLDSISKKYNVYIEGQNEYMPLWYTLSCDEHSYGDALKTAALFYEMGIFDASEPSLIVSNLLNENNIIPYAVSLNDTYYPQQWNLKGNYSINWTGAYEISRGKGVTVGVFDQGIDILNPDLKSAKIGCYDTVSKDMNLPIVMYGNHGTAVAGIICAMTNNGIGIAGIAPDASVYSIANPLTASPDIAQQLANGFVKASTSCEVINCSWSGDALKSSLIDDAIRLHCQLWGRKGKGNVIIFATGNDSKSSVNYPGSSNDYLIRVGWSTQTGRRHSASNYGDDLDFVAPGGPIVTTDRSGSLGYVDGDYYMNFNGTSAAAPHVAGIAALMLSVNSNLTAAEVKEILAKTARKVGNYEYKTYSDKPYGTWNREMGYGLVDAEAAVKAAKQKL